MNQNQRFNFAEFNSKTTMNRLRTRIFVAMLLFLSAFSCANANPSTLDIYTLPLRFRTDSQNITVFMNSLNILGLGNAQKNGYYGDAVDLAINLWQDIYNVALTAEKELSSSNFTGNKANVEFLRDCAIKKCLETEVFLKKLLKIGQEPLYAAKKGEIILLCIKNPVLYKVLRPD